MKIKEDDMKYLLFLFVFLFVASACDNTDQFASLANDANQQASEDSKYKKDLKSIASNEVELKIGGKKRQSIKIADTVGEKNLDKGTKVVTTTQKAVTTTQKAVITTNIKVADVTVEEAVHKEAEETVDKETVVSNTKISATEKKLDLLFYMHNRKSKCIQNIRLFAEKKGFLNRLDHLDWQVSFSYYSQNDSFLPLEIGFDGRAYNTIEGFSGVFKHKPDHILSKGEYSAKKRDRLFNTTLRAVYPDYDNPNFRTIDQLNSNGYISNPLSGLDQLLSSEVEGSVRLDSHVVVLFFGYDFPYYSSEEWRTFFKKHKDVSVIVLSPRSANVSNLVHALEKSEYDFDFLAACDTRNSPEHLVEAINKKVQ